MEKVNSAKDNPKDSGKDNTKDDDKDNTKDDDKVAIVCVRCDELPSHIPGAIIKKCDFCNAKVWFSPSSIGKKFDIIYCQECWQLDFNEKEDSIFLTKESFEEFNKWHLETFGYELEIEDIIKVMEKETGRKVKIGKMDDKVP